MTENAYRIRTNVGEEPNVINVKLNQTFDTLEILSLKISQEDTYKLYKSSYGVIVGRVLANGGVGIPNAKVSVFIESETSENNLEKILYPYTSVASRNQKGIRYNLLPDSVDDKCYQNVGTFPNKRLMLDNNDVLEIFDKYYKYTTCTNQSGDYMLCNIPVGAQQIHVDVDLSDIGFLSQRPRDMIYKGTPSRMFESPNKFKQDTNIDSLAQIRSQNIGVYVFPFWGDTTEDDNIAITRCDIQIDYKFEPTCVFMGATFADNDGHIGKKCGPSKNQGKMADLITSQGKIEMIRKTNDGHVEEFSIMGNRLIDEDGIFCYQIPMNLDYVTTDEFGNLVPTDDPNKGIPTRTSVRFRFTLDDEIGNVSKVKRCSYLVPNNPRINEDYTDFTETRKVDYEFGSLTKDENYRDLFWNKVYTIKSFIPRLQKDDDHKSKEFLGIKWINHGGDKNRFPYNGLTIKLSFQYMLLCFITKFIIYAVAVINNILSTLGTLPCKLAEIFRGVNIFGLRPFKKLSKWLSNLIPDCIKMGTEFCDDGQNKIIFYPGCIADCVWKHNKEEFEKTDEYQNGWNISNEPKSIFTLFGLHGDTTGLSLMTCVENALIQENECTSYNFYNDWINGALFFPKWHRYIRPKQRFFFGLFKRRAKDEWCSSERNIELYYVQHCAVSKKPHPKECGDDCESSVEDIDIKKGIVVSKETMLKQTVYYYKSAEYLDSIQDVMLLFATDIVLLGSLNENDIDGTPQFFKNLPITTYQLPTDVLDVDHHIEKIEFEADGRVKITTESDVEGSGQDWSNENSELCGDGTTGDSGLFYGVGCSHVNMKVKSCVNLRRICELGVSLDETQEIPINTMNKTEEESDYRRLVSDGFVSWDEIYDNDSRAMFATMNHNALKTEINKQTGYKQYKYTYLYPINFDGALRPSMEDRQKSCDKSYKNNYILEEESTDYVAFRMGEKPYYYDSNNKMPRYENSFYFYFGLTPGHTAIEKFQSEYFADCENTQPIPRTPIYSFVGNKWCYDRIDVDEDGELEKDEMNRRDGYLKLDLSKLIAPFTIQFTNTDRMDLSDLILNDINFEKVYIGNTTEYLLNQNIISADDAKIRNEKLDGYEHLTFDKYGNIFYDSNDPEPSDMKDHKNTYLYDNCTLCNGNWHLTITDGEETVVELDVPFYAEKLKCNVIVDSFRLASNNLYQEKKYNDENTSNKPPFSPNEWWKVVSLSDLTYNANTNRKEREIGGLIIIKDIVQEQTLLTNKDVYIKIESISNILNEGYLLYDEDGIPLEPIIVKAEDGKIIDSYYLINDVKYLCDPNTYYVYKLDDKGNKCRPDVIYDNKNNIVKWEDLNENDITKVLTQKQGLYFYHFNNKMCDKDGYLFDTKVDVVNGNKKFIVDSETMYGKDYINDDYGFIHYDDNDTDEDKERDVFYFGVPIGGQQYKITVTYKCSTDYNDDGYDDITDNSFTQIVKVNEFSPTKFYINNIDYDIIKNFKSGWNIYDTREKTLNLYENINTSIKKIVGWNKITDIGVQSLFTKENIPDWSKLELYVKYLSTSREYLIPNGKDLCPYIWTDYYIYNRSEYDELCNIIKQYYISSTPKEIYNYQIAENLIENNVTSSNMGFLYEKGRGDIYKLNINEGDAIEFVSSNNYNAFSFYKKKDSNNTVTEENINYYSILPTENSYTTVAVKDDNGIIKCSEDSILTIEDFNIPFEEDGSGNFYYYLNDVAISVDDNTIITNTTIKIQCDEKGVVFVNTPILILDGNNFVELKIDINNNDSIVISNITIYIEDNDEDVTKYIYATKNGERYKIPNTLIFNNGSVYKYTNVYYVKDKIINGTQYYKEIPCDKLGYVYAVKYNDEIQGPLQYEMYELPTNTDLGERTKVVELFVIPKYVDVLCNTDGFVYGQKRLQDFYYPDMFAPMGGWWLGCKRYEYNDGVNECVPYNFYDLYSTTEQLSQYELGKIIYDTYGRYILDESDNIIFVETFNNYETSNGELCGYKYATEKDGKTKLFKKAPRNNVFKLNNQTTNTTDALIYMYHPNIKNPNAEKPNERGYSYLCDSEGYVYETTEDRKCIAEKLYKKILQYYYLDNNKKIECDGEGYVYETDETGEKIKGEDVNIKVNIYGEFEYYYYLDENDKEVKCDKNGYKFQVNGETQEVVKTDKEIKVMYYKVYENGYYKYAKINNYYKIIKTTESEEEKTYRQYFALTDNGTTYQDNNAFTEIYCDKYGYIYKCKSSDISSIETYEGDAHHDNLLGYYTYNSSTNEIIQLDKITEGKYYVYALLNGAKFKLSEENKIKYSVNKDLFYYENINQNGKFKINEYSYNTIVKLNTKGIVKHSTNDSYNNENLMREQVNMPCDNNGNLYIVDELGEKYNPLNSLKQDYYGNEYIVIDNKTVYISKDKQFVYDTYMGQKYKLIKPEECSNDIWINFLENNNFSIDDEGFVKSTNTINLTREGDDIKYQLQIPFDKFVYDVKNCGKYILPYEILEKEDNFNECDYSNTTVLCDKDGYVYETDENSKKIKCEGVDGIEIFEYCVIKDENTLKDVEYEDTIKGYYYSIGGPIKLYIDDNFLIKEDIILENIPKLQDGEQYYYCILPSYYRQNEILKEWAHPNSPKHEMKPFIEYGLLIKIECTENGEIIGGQKFQYDAEIDDSIFCYDKEQDCYYVDVNPNKVFCDENGNVDNIVYRSYYTEEDSNIYYNYGIFAFTEKYEHGDESYENVYVLNQEPKGSLLYDINGIEILSDNFGYIKGFDDDEIYQLKKSVKIVSKNVFYYIINNQKIYCDEYGTIESLGYSLTNLKHFNQTVNEYEVDGIICDRYGYIYRLDEGGNKIQGNGIQNHTGSYFYINENNVKIPCDINGYVYAVNGNNEPYLLENYVKNIECDEYGNVYRLDKDGNKIKLVSTPKENITFNNIVCDATKVTEHIYINYDKYNTLNDAVEESVYCDEDGNLLLQDEYGNFLFDKLKLHQPYGAPYKLYNKERTTIDVNNSKKDYSKYIKFYYDIPNTNFIILCDNNGKKLDVYGNDEEGFYYLFDNNGSDKKIKCNYNGYILNFEEIKYPDGIKPYKHSMNIYCDRYGNIINTININNEETNYHLFDVFKWDNENLTWVRQDSFILDNILSYGVYDEGRLKDTINFYPIDGKYEQIYCEQEGYVSWKKNGEIYESYKLNNFIDKITYIEKYYTNTTKKMWCYLIEDVNNITHRIFVDVEENKILDKTPNNEKYKLELQFKYDSDNRTHYYIIITKQGEEFKVLCDSDGCIKTVDNLWPVEGNKYLNRIYSYPEKYYYYDLVDCKIYCDAAGYVKTLTPNNEKYKLENIPLLCYDEDNGISFYTNQSNTNSYFQYISFNNVYLDNDYKVLNEKKTPIINNYEVQINKSSYKLYNYDVKGEANFYKYNDATYCDKNGIIIENVKLKYNENTSNNIDKNNIIIYNSLFNFYEYRNEYEFIPCDKEGYIYAVDNNGEIEKTAINNGLYTSYYESVEMPCIEVNDGKYYLLETDENFNKVEFVNNGWDEPTNDNGVFIFNIKVECDKEGYVYDTVDTNTKYGYKYVNYNYEKTTVKNDFKTEHIVKNTVDDANFFYYKYNNTPCDKDGYVYKVDVQGEKYKLENEILNNGDGYYYEVIVKCGQKDGKYYRYAINSEGNIITLNKTTMDIPCDWQGYVYSIDNNGMINDIPSKRNFIIYNTDKQYYEYRYKNSSNKEIQIPCDREGKIYTLKNGEPYKLIEETIKSLEYNVENGYKYKLFDNSRVRKYKRLPYRNNLEDVYKYVIYNENNENEEYQLCNKDGFIIIEESSDVLNYNGNNIDGYEYTDSTKCDVDGFVYQTIGGELATEEDLYSFYNTISLKFNEIINNINIYIQRRLDFVKKMQSIFWIDNINEPKMLQLSSQTDFTPVEYKIGYIKEEYVINDIDKDDDDITDETNERYEIASTTYTFTNQNKLDVAIPTYTPYRGSRKNNLFVGQNSNGESNIDNEINVYKYKAPYIVGMKNSINNTYPPIKAEYFKIENPRYIGNELFHLHFIDKPFKIEFECMATLVDYPIIPTNAVELWSKSRGYINIDGIMYNCNVHNGAITYDDFDKNNFHFEKQKLNNADVKMVYQGSRDEDGYIVRRVVSYENDWDIEGIMSRQSEEIKTDTLAEFVCKPYIDAGMNPCLLPPTRSQLTIKDNFRTLNEIIYSNMSITILQNSLDDVELKYRVNNGDGNEEVFLTTYDAYDLGFATEMKGDMFDNKYHLFKHGIVIDFKNKVLRTKDKYPISNNGNRGSIMLDNPISDLNEWTTYILVARTQNNCYTISKPFSLMKPKVYRLSNISLKIQKYNASYKFSNYIKSNGDKTNEIKIYYYIVTNPCCEYSFKKDTYYIQLPTGYTNGDILQFVNDNDVIYITYNELIEALNNYTYMWNRTVISIGGSNFNCMGINSVISDNENEVKFEEYNVEEYPFDNYNNGNVITETSGDPDFNQIYYLNLIINFDTQNIKLLFN